MTLYGPIRIGRVTLTEDWVAADKGVAGAGGKSRAISVSGQESATLLGSAAVARSTAEAFIGMNGRVVPVVFSAMTHRSGWYEVTNTDVDEESWESWSSLRWKATLDYVGTDSAVEVESRLIGGNRTHVAAVSAELWHAPAGSHNSYFVGTNSPGVVDRVGAAGTVRVYRSIPAGVNPRWAAPVASYYNGEVSVTVNGALLGGLTCDDTPSSWILSNTLVKVEARAGAGTIRVTSHNGGGGWGTPKVFDIKRGATSLGAATHVTVVRNDPCECIIRLTWDHAPGRSVCDLTLKRGARHVGLYVQQFSAGSALRVDDNGVTASVNNQLAAAGYIATSVDDGNGNRWVIGTPKAGTAAGGFGFAQTVTALDLSAYIGVVRAGGSAAAGDTAAVVNQQYLGSPAELELVVAR